MLTTKLRTKIRQARQAIEVDKARLDGLQKKCRAICSQGHPEQAEQLQLEIEELRLSLINAHLREKTMTTALSLADISDNLEKATQLVGKASNDLLRWSLMNKKW